MKIAQISGIISAPHVNQIEKKNNFQFLSVNRADSVTFSGNTLTKQPLNIDIETAEFVANSLSTSTSGHRATYGTKTFDKNVVTLLTLGVADYAKEKAKEKGKKPVVIIGGDTRIATKESLPLISEVLRKQGVDVLYMEKPVPTPVLAYATKKYGIDVGILMTASHNPWSDGGYNLVTDEGAIAPAPVTKKIADYAVNHAKVGYYYEDNQSAAKVDTIFPYQEYSQKLDSLNLINWDKIRESGISITYDPLRGTGANVLPQLLDEHGIKANIIDSGEKTGPNPTASNLGELKEALLNDKSPLKGGITTDGDADRFGILDEKGNFITPNDVIKLLAYHLTKNKGLKGDIVRSQGTSSMLDKVAEEFGAGHVETPVGFKYIADVIIEHEEKHNPILIAGEESGGLTVQGHIPEKDGILADLLILDLIATEGKPLSEILTNIDKELGISMVNKQISKELKDDAAKAQIMQKAADIRENSYNGKIDLGDGIIIDAEATHSQAQNMESFRKGGDGVKLLLTDGSSILIRKSGTEPKVKAYIEAAGKDDKAAAERAKVLTAKAEEIFNIENKGEIMQTQSKMVSIPGVDTQKYAEMATKAVKDVEQRAGKPGQFLNWIGILPQNQLENIDSIYELADKAKSDGTTDLAIFGIGGSRHTTEAMMKLMGNDSHIHFFSAVSDESFKRFTSNLNLSKTKFMVVSKSGGTMETKTAYEKSKKLMQNFLATNDVSDSFIAMTDASDKSDLRKLVNAGEFKLSGLVHDDVGGRFSIFDDATIFALAFSGVPKSKVIAMLKASVEAQKEFMNPDINKNEALQLAAFNADAKLSGKSINYVEYFGNEFEGANLWEKQLKNESIKSAYYTDTNVGPGYLHYNAESDLDAGNKNSFYTFVTTASNEKVTNAIFEGVFNAYSAQHPAAKVVLKDLSPESIARFIELKHFETLYTGNMIRQASGNTGDMSTAMPEVLQPNVEIYKKAVREAMAK